MAPSRQPDPPVGTAFALRDPLPWGRFAGSAQLGEALGYRAVFLPEIAGRDAFAALTGLAAETNRLLLATGIVPMTSRLPRTTAMGIATVHERSGGRAVLGLGTGPARPGALATLASQVRELRALLDAGPRDGAAGGADPLSLELPGPVPIWIAALGPRSVRLAGELADGVLLNWCSPQRVVEARTDVRAAARTSGRDPDAVTVGVYVRACLEQPDPDAAMRAVKAAVGEYASHPAYARQFAAMGWQGEAESAVQACRANRSEDVPQALVDAVCLVGDVSTARARLDAYRRSGASMPVVYPVLVAGVDPAASVEATLRALAPTG
jgi:alkanesulfonate monooxygenase SsuD/methylene tetrahydromethanopterin reductase-like flavin-dependent oxidoreductase (luciferase family)